MIRTNPEVAEALASGRPVVALETAAVTHGLPRIGPVGIPGFELPASIASDSTPAAVRTAFAPNVPLHRALGHALVAAVRAEGAVPATVGFLHGELVIGLTSDELDELADAPDPVKVSARDAGLAAARGSSGGTTVAGTVLACTLAQPARIRVFATGGIGGVHRGFASLPDVSADLHAIRDGGALVVSAGAKSILDLPATVETLDTLGVPVVGLGTRNFPRFLSEGDATLPTGAADLAHDPADAARIFAMSRRFLPDRGMLLCVPPPASDAIPTAEMEAAIAAGLAECARRGIRGASVTPALLASVATASGGRSLATNLGVLVQNARIGARVARALAESPP